MSENKVGRPPKLSEDDLDKILRAARCGLTDKQIAMIWGVTFQTLNNYKTQHPEFFESLKQQKALADVEVIDSLRQRAVGYTCKEEKQFVIKNKVVTHEAVKHYPPDPTSMIFWLKNRQPELFRDKQEHEISIDEFNFVGDDDE